MEDTLKAIIFNKDFTKLYFFMGLQITSYFLALFSSVSHDKIESYINNANSLVFAEKLSIIHRLAHRVIFIFYVTITVSLLFPSNILLFKHLYGIITLSALILGLFTFLYEIFADLLFTNMNKRRMVSILLILTISMFVLGIFTKF